jgi:hypothetical protein
MFAMKNSPGTRKVVQARHQAVFDVEPESQLRLEKQVQREPLEAAPRSRLALILTAFSAYTGASMFRATVPAGGADESCVKPLSQSAPGSVPY